MYIYTSHYYGHPIYWDESAQDWCYTDNDDFIHYVEKRACPKCKELPTKDGHDPCIANLPHIKAACCGHGVEDGYILFDDDETILDGTFKKAERIRKDPTYRPKKR